ncbi:hypothetical protein L484_017036 [Morus notabilis]|uniref:Uncharacterized protein n=1 Tax=Morus notabilis TaxID=981085 RepID=W9RU82_9ROSA|nr:hypothetical protein L484_017036 [Morus notabilis]
MKQRRIFAQLVNQWQEEAKEDFKAQKRRLEMQQSGMQRTLLGYSAQRNAKKSREQGERRLQRTKVGCSVPKSVPSSKNARCSAPKGLQCA